MKLLRLAVLTVVLLAAFALPGFAYAGSGPTITSGIGSATIDGTIDSQWAGAQQYDLTLGASGPRGTVFLMNDSSNLYVGFQIVDPASAGKNFLVSFDNANDSILSIGDDRWENFELAPDGADRYWNGQLWTNDDNNQIFSRRTYDTNTHVLTIEMQRSLYTDDGQDVFLRFGQTYGIVFRYTSIDSAGSFPAGANPDDPSAYANLDFQDNVSPNVSVTDPAAGTVLSGVVNVAADASDNVGVSRVAFSYFDGTTDTETSLGTDTDPPYTASFDTRQFPDTLPLDGTVYAEAFDAAGNSRKAGNGVTINNGTSAPDTFITSGPGLTFSGSATFTFASDVPGVTFACRLDNPGGSGTILFTPCATPKTYSDLADGPHLFEVRAVNDTVFDLTPATSNFLAQPTPAGRIVFESNRPGSSQPGTDIYSMAPDGSDVQHLTFNEGSESRPTLSPDGSRVAFVSGGDIYMVSATDPGIPQQLTTTGNNDAPAFSPNGRELAFDSTRSGDSNLYRMPITGGTPIQITFNEAFDGNPSWSPDGTHIVFDSTRSGDSEIWTALAKGGAENALVQLTHQVGRDYDPAWSPDGSTILYASEVGSSLAHVYTISATTGDSGGLVPPVAISGGTAFAADPTWSPDGNYVAFTRDVSVQNYHLLVATADGAQQIEVAVGGTRNSFASWAGTAAVPTDSLVSINGPATSQPGAAVAPLTDDMVQALRGTSAADASTSAAPLGGIPLGGIPLGGIPLGGIPLGGIPLAGIGWTAADLQQNGLGGVPLSTIPLKAPDRWEAHLPASLVGKPTQNITLAQILGTSAAQGVTLNDIDLSSSPLGGIPLGGIAFGALPLGGIPLGGIPLGGIGAITTAKNLADWCAYINSQPGFSCTDPNSLANTTMIGLALRGVPMGGIPLGGIPLAGIPLAGIPLGGIAVGTPLGGIPLGGIDLAGTPLGGIPLGGINMALSPLGGIPLGGIPLSAKQKLFDCSTPAFLCLATDTIGGAKAAGVLKVDAKIEDIGFYRNANGSPITLAQLILGLPPETSLGDLLATILTKAAYDWESLPLTFPLQDFATAGAVVTYTVNFTVNGTGGGSTAADVTVHLPPDARYVLGSSRVALGDVDSTATDDPVPGSNADELVWSFDDVPLGGTNQLTFRARPGLTLGTETAAAKLDVTAIPTSVAAPAATVLTQTFPGNSSPGSEFVPLIQPDTLYVGYTPNGTDKDFFKIPAPPPGTQRIIHLSHLQVDDDLVVYGQAPLPLRDPKPGSVPLGGQSVLDVPFALDQRSQAIIPEPQTDVPQNAGVGSVLGVSDNRGLADEDVTLNTPEDTGGLQYIQISSFDGGHSNEPWILRVEDIPAIPLPAASTCTMPPVTGGGVVHTMPTIPAAASTLYLFNSKRFGDIFGTQAETDVWNRLQTMAARTDAAGGAVVPLEADSPTATAYGAWTSTAANYCSPGRANDVVRSIGRLLDGITTPTVKNIVLVGDDTVIPYGRVLDNTSYANERGYTTTFLQSLNVANNQYMNSYGIGFLPTDDSYGDTNYTGAGPYVPELAVGRLVEKPDQILAQLNQYIARNGAITPTSSFVAGYDFLKDGATAVSNALKPTVGTANAREMINDTWNRQNLIDGLFPTINPPNIVSINAHFDHNRSLPANENAAQIESILFTTADVSSRGPQAVAGRIIFTMGCHSALNVSDFVVSPALQPDWAQTFAAGGAIVYMGNLGYGLGDTVAVAYSERLHQLFAQRLNGTMTVGEALTFAKQEYGSAPALSGYDLKVINEAELSGLPMYRLGNGTPPAAPPPAQLVTDAATGLPSSLFGITPTFTRNNVATGSYYSSDGGASFQNRRPIEPLSNVDVTQPGLVAHGVIITKATSVDEFPFDAAFSRVVEDLSAFSPELVGDVVYPTKLQSIATLSTPTGVQQRAVLFTGQFRNDAVNDPQGIGTQRRFTALSGSTLFTQPTATDFAPPNFGPVQVTKALATVGFAVDVTDYNENHVAVPNDRVKRVLALYKDASGGVWKAVDLSRVGTSARWSGGGSVTGDTVEWFIQAVDSFGNVGVTSNKADVHSLTPPPIQGTVSASLAGPLHSSGWYTGAVTVTLSATGQDVSITSSVDGAPFQAYTAPFAVSGSGVHTVEFAGSDGSHGSVAIPIDTTAPTVSFANPGILMLGQTAPFDFFTCADAGSGVSTCTVTGVDTSTVTSGTSTRTARVHAVDRVGNTVDVTGTYRVVWAFRGFLPFVQNPPVINRRFAGQIVLLRFSLGGNRGLNILASGYPKSVSINCPAGGVVSDGTEESTNFTPGLVYIPLILQQYIYVWKTDTAWRGTCRRFVMRLADGTDHVADFKFR